jgi:hypothetical protein
LESNNVTCGEQAWNALGKPIAANPGRECNITDVFLTLEEFEELLENSPITTSNPLLMLIGCPVLIGS